MKDMTIDGESRSLPSGRKKRSVLRATKNVKIASSPASEKSEGHSRKKSQFANTGFPESEKARAFRRRFYPDATRDDWSDWGWQVRHRIRNLDDLARIIRLS